MASNLERSSSPIWSHEHLSRKCISIKTRANELKYYIIERKIYMKENDELLQFTFVENKYWWKERKSLYKDLFIKFCCSVLFSPNTVRWMELHLQELFIRYLRFRYIFTVLRTVCFHRVTIDRCFIPRILFTWTNNPTFICSDSISNRCLFSIHSTKTGRFAPSNKNKNKI